jgi:hypothetical protein
MLIAILASTAVVALVLMLAFPETPTGKWLHRILVEKSAEFLMDLTWAKVGALLISLAVVVFLISIGPEGVAVLTAAGADAALLEVMLSLWLASTFANVAGAWRSAKRLAAKPADLVRSVLAKRSRARLPRSKRFRSRRKADDKDEPGWAFA